MINSDMARSSDEHPPALPAWSFRRPPRRSVQVLTPPVGPHTDPVLHALRFPVDACVPLSLRPARPLPLVRGEPVGWRLHDSKRRACVRTNGLIARTMLHTPSLFRGGGGFACPRRGWVGLRLARGHLKDGTQWARLLARRTAAARSDGIRRIEGRGSHCACGVMIDSERIGGVFEHRFGLVWGCARALALRKLPFGASAWTRRTCLGSTDALRRR